MSALALGAGEVLRWYERHERFITMASVGVTLGGCFGLFGWLRTWWMAFIGAFYLAVFFLTVARWRRGRLRQPH